jgi:ubiquinone/menaquinone biosynthesis C-methylase UbiE
MEAKKHWEQVYSTKSIDSISWHQAHAARSLHLIHETGLSVSASIIDVGGGASTLVDDLLGEGFSSLTVLDLSAAALSSARSRLGERAECVVWIEANITDVVLSAEAYDLWYDRACFHFLTTRKERKAYISTLQQAVKAGGYVIIASFAHDGPSQCSGLPVMCYSPEELHAEIGQTFTLLKQESEDHQTPSGTVQKFIYCFFQRVAVNRAD